MATSFADYDQALRRFEKIDRKAPRSRTVLEIAGYPNYENYASNVLAFYLDSSEDHNLESLCLRSLLIEALGELPDEDLGVEEVRREEPTASGKRLDIVVLTASAVVGIENKIHAPVNNDLNDYRRHLDELASREGKAVWPILLSMRHVDPGGGSHGFVTVTYERFLTRVQRDLGPQLLTSRGRYLEFLLEFIETMLALGRRQTVDGDLWDFFDSEESTVASLFRETNNFRRELKRRVDLLAEIARVTGESDVVTQRTWAEEPRHLSEFVHKWVTDIQLREDLLVTVEAELRPTGWSVVVWPRQGRRESFDRLLKDLGLTGQPSPHYPDRLVLDGSEFDRDSEIDRVAEYLLGKIAVFLDQAPGAVAGSS